jgi:hypothetical protein
MSEDTKQPEPKPSPVGNLFDLMVRNQKQRKRSPYYDPFEGTVPDWSGPDPDPFAPRWR